VNFINTEFSFLNPGYSKEYVTDGDLVELMEIANARE